ncbi:uncharacterized membrane protein YebE (DUF533 family) [Hasllibacter halocynthiae]|uniref:Uncharacterized membrane protein YebE (DUF533 family) n=1 Tax=Hasllibacter halocynthiae TaxID=595589 RepID=A0A2T0X9R1_9RHOB|nr:DUF533 domain-containing protein [Hasllibacter halocynthiae]PRY95682.1 uncharacterized membrane protein YebE (DUF533 family) [Hasllibacter halocynthiae]
MSLVRTLAKVAIGVAVAKGINSMRGKAPRGAGTLPGGRSLGSLLGSGGLGSLASSLMGGGTAGAGMGAPAAGTGTPMRGGPGTGTRIGAAAQQPAAGLDLAGLGGRLGGMLGGQASPGSARGGSQGGLGGLLAGLGGGAAAGGLGSLLNQALAGQPPEREPTVEEEDAARAMMVAMVHAMKADGRIDSAERARLLDHLGELAPEERAAIEAELEGPADASAVARKTPRGTEAQVYAAALMAIDIDEESERRWLAELAAALGLSQNRQDDVRGAMDALD